MYRLVLKLTILLVAAVSVMLGCANAKTKLNPVFFENKTATIAIGLTPYPVTGYNYKCVDRGPIGCIIELDQTRDAGLFSYLQKYDYAQFYKIKDLFADELKKRGMQVLSLNDINLISRYQELLESESLSISSSAFKALSDQTNADFLILFQVERCGVMWSVHGFNTAYGKPGGHFHVNGYLFNLHSGKVEWKYVGDFNDRPIWEEWNQSPDYPNVAKAIHEAIALSINKLFNSFFNRLP